MLQWTTVQIFCFLNLYATIAYASDKMVSSKANIAQKLMEQDGSFRSWCQDRTLVFVQNVLLHLFDFVFFFLSLSASD
jgi:hypothetical protein